MPTGPDDHLEAFRAAVRAAIHGDPGAPSPGAIPGLTPGAVPIGSIPGDHPLAQMLSHALAAKGGGGAPAAASADPSPEVLEIDFDRDVPATAAWLRSAARSGDVPRRYRAGYLALADALDTLPRGWLPASLAIQVAVMTLGPAECACYDSAQSAWLSDHAREVDAAFRRIRAAAGTEGRGESAETHGGSGGPHRRRGLICRLCGWAARRFAEYEGRLGG